MTKVSPFRKLPRLKTRFHFVKPARPHNEDWNRMVWATFKPFVLLFASLTVILLIANMLYYQHKWSTPQKSEKCEFRTCLMKKDSNETLEILVKMFRKHSMLPIAHHISLVGLICLAAIFGNLFNEFTLSYYPAYALSVIWIHEHYHNFRIIMNSSSVLYNLAHLTHILAALSCFAFAATVLGKKPQKVEPLVINEEHHHKEQPVIQPTNDTQSEIEHISSETNVKHT